MAFLIHPSLNVLKLSISSPIYRELVDSVSGSLPEASTMVICDHSGSQIEPNRPIKNPRDPVDHQILHHFIYLWLEGDGSSG